MAKISDSMARWYAAVNDDVRHHVVDRGMYNIQQRQDVMSSDVNRTIDATYAGQESEPQQQFAEVYGRDPHVPEHMEGIGARGVDDPNGEAVRDVTHAYYGYDQGDEARGTIERAEELYGQDYAQTDSQDFYGYDHAEEPQQADLYGYQRPDIEQDR